METIILLGSAATLLAVPFLVTRYWQHLPEAPSCPHCRAVTHRMQHHPVALRLLGALPIPATTMQSCSECGWQGRMRWRWAPHRVRHDAAE